MGQSSRKQLCWYNPQAWYRKLLFITVHLLVVIQICKMFGSFRFFHAITPNVGWTFFSLCFLFPSLLVYGSICPQRGRNQGKSDKIFFWAFVLCGEVDKMALLRVFLSHVRAYARAFQQRCWFFAVTSVTQGKNLEGKTEQILEGGKERKTTFGRVFGLFSVFEIRVC